MAGLILQKQINYKRILLHILFWLSYIVINDILYAFRNGLYYQTLLSLLSTLPLDILATYITLYFFIPKFLLKKKYLEFGIYFSISVAFIVLFEKLINLYFVYPYIYNYPIGKYPFWSIDIFRLAISIYSVVAVAVVLKLIKIWFHNQQLEDKLKNQNLQSELALLRSQINPHFLFNTLNNIDSLIYKNQDKASDAVIKLSEIMRYMLYDANDSKVQFENELNYLQNYISLLRLRVKHPEFIQFNIKGNFARKKIAPMLIVPFIENAYKHGNKKIEKNGIIINIELIDNLFTFIISNYISNSKNNTKNVGGIGLNNVKRRLKLIYDDKANLIIKEENKQFIVKLTIVIE